MADFNRYSHTHSSSRTGFLDDSEADSTPANASGTALFDEVPEYEYSEKPSSARRRFLIGAAVAIGVALVIIAGIVLGVYFGVVKNKKSNSNAAASGSSGSPDAGGGKNGTSTPSSALTTGGDGSKITTEDGSTFTYSNKFGGYWIFDPANPFIDGARAQSWTPALNDTFHYGVDRIRGCVSVFSF